MISNFHWRNGSISFLEMWGSPRNKEWHQKDCLSLRKQCIGSLQDIRGWYCSRSAIEQSPEVNTSSFNRFSSDHTYISALEQYFSCPWKALKTRCRSKVTATRSYCARKWNAQCAFVHSFLRFGSAPTVTHFAMIVQSILHAKSALLAEQLQHQFDALVISPSSPSPFLSLSSSSLFLLTPLMHEPKHTTSVVVLKSF